MVYTHTINIKSKKELDIIKITEEVRDALKKSKIKDGIAVVFIPGATGAITTIEYEEGLLQDFVDMLQKVVPENAGYLHDSQRGDDNGRSHVRASMIGPGVTIPFKDEKLILGTWQEIIFIELDTKPRQRQIMVQVVGE